MKKQIRQIRMSIGSKVSLLILAVAVLSIVSHSLYSQKKYNVEKQQFLSQSLLAIGSSEAAGISEKIKALKQDMTNILSLIGEQNPSAKKVDISILVQKNSSLKFFQILEMDSTRSRIKKEVLTILNSSPHPATTQLELPWEEESLRSLAKEKIKNYRYNDPSSLNYYSEFSSDYPSFFIFEISNKRNLIGLFFVDPLFFQTTSQQTPFEHTIYNQTGDIIAQKKIHTTRTKERNLHLFLNLKNQTSSFGLIEHEHTVDPASELTEKPSYLAYFHKLGDNLMYVTEVNLSSFFPAQNIFTMDTLGFILFATLLIWLMGYFFSHKWVTTPIGHLTSILENMLSGNYYVSERAKGTDEMAQWTDYCSALGKRLKDHEGELHHAQELASRDGLTGVYNHRYFQESLTRLFEEHRKKNQPLSLIIMDIDFYKRFNDEYGHLQGDLVIRELAQILVSATRRSDIVARYGGDEFALVLTNTDTELAQQIGERIRTTFQSQRFKKLNSDNDAILSGTCSLGIATFLDGNFKNKEDLLQAADKNLYKAKKLGRNRVFAS
ncbi:MAG: GGDEF domain-containing protein [Bdellovibrionales bacterium]